MFNNSSITKSKLTSPKQILANVDIQASIGCVVPTTLGVTVNGKKIAKAGTPIKVNFDNLTQEVVKGDGTNAMNAVLLHDVDVSYGANNGVALYMGAVNVNRVDSDVATLITTAKAAAAKSPLIVFIKA